MKKPKEEEGLRSPGRNLHGLCKEPQRVEWLEQCQTKEREGSYRPGKGPQSSETGAMECSRKRMMDGRSRVLVINLLLCACVRSDDNFVEYILSSHLFLGLSTLAKPLPKYIKCSIA